MLRVHPRDEADLLWLWNESSGEIEGLRSLHAATEAQLMARANCTPWASPGLICGRIYVPTTSDHAATEHHLDGRALAAATRERRIRHALEGAGTWAASVLALRYGTILTPSRAMFTRGAGERVRRTLQMASSPNKVTRERIRLSADAFRTQPERGAGSGAHLTDAAVAAHAASRSALSIGAWVDRLGRVLSSTGACAFDRALQRDITAQAEDLVLKAYERYRRAAVRVPELVRRRAQARVA